MTCSKNFGRLLQVTCLGLIGTLAVVGCGGSETTKHDGGPDAIGGEVGGSTAALNLDKYTVNLGTLDVKGTGVATVTVTNTGKATSGVVAVTASTGVTATGCASALAAGAACTITITATPTAAGAFSGTVSITANPGAVTPLTVSVIAQVSGNLLFTVSPPAIDLGNVAVGVAAPKQTITVTAAVAISDLTVTSTGVDVAIDKVTSTCTTALAANASCVVYVNFTAVAAGTRSDSVVISGGGTAGKVQSVPITAVAQKPPLIVINPSTQQALAASVGTTSSAITFGVANTGDVATGTINVAITGTNAANFKATSSCLILAPLAGCTVSVTFTPVAVGTVPANLVVTDTGAGASSVTVALSGVGSAASNLAITPATSDLGSVLVGTTGAATIFTVTNTGDTASGSLTDSVTSTDFVITNDTCVGTSLAAKTGACTIGIALKPTTIGAKSATLTVTGTNGLPAVRTLTGTGMSQASLTATPSSLDFGTSIRVNKTAAPQIVTVKNTGGAATGTLSFVKGGLFGEFPITANSCSAPLAPAATCTFTVVFAPTKAGSESATYTISDGSASATVSVSGSAQPSTGLAIENAGGSDISTIDSCVLNQAGTAFTKDPCYGDTVVAGSTLHTNIKVVADSSNWPAGVADTGKITVALVPADTKDFTIVTDQCTGKALVSGGECLLTVEFTPTAAGPRQAQLSVTSDNGGYDTLSLQGTGLAIVQIVAGDSETVAALTSSATDPKATDLDFGQVANLGSPDTTAFSGLGYPNKSYTVIVRGPIASGTPFPTTTIAATLTNPSTPSDFNYLVLASGNYSRATANPCASTVLAPSITTKPGGASGTNAANWTYDAAQQGWICTFIMEFFPQSGKGTKAATLTATGSAGGTDTVTFTGVATGPLTLNATPLAFPEDIMLGESSNDINLTLTLTDVRPNLTLTLKNGGQANQGPFTIALGGTDATQFHIVNETCSLKHFGAATVGTLAQNETCLVEVAFTPTSAGAKSGTVTVTGTGGETATATFTANGTPTLPTTVSPTAVDFGTVIQTATSDWKTITIANPAGAAATNQISYSIAGPASGSRADVFATADASSPALGTCGLSGHLALAATQTCTILVQFKPLSATPLGVTTPADATTPTAWLEIDTGAPAPLKVPLTGTVGSMLTVTPATLDFGNVPSGGTSSSQTLTVKNVGAAAATLAFANVSVFSSVTTGTTCTTAGGGLAAGATCTIALQMGTDATQTLGVKIDPAVDYNIGYGTALATSQLTGTPVQPALLVAAGVAQTGNVIDLGSVRVGTTSGNAVVLFKNMGGVATTPLQFKWGTTSPGATDAEFGIGTETGSCIGSQLQPGKTCTVTVNFKPTGNAGGRDPKLLTLQADQGGTVAAFSFQATAQSATSSAYITTVTGSNAGFATLAGKTAIGGKTTQELQLTNGTGSALSNLAIAFTTQARDLTDFSTTAIDLTDGGAATACSPTGTSPFSLPAGQGCTFLVTFNPNVDFADDDVLTLATPGTPDYVRWATVNATSGSTVIKMGILGVVQSPAKLTVSPAYIGTATSVPFGEVALNSTKALPFVVTNVGDTATKTLAVTSSTGAFTADAGCNVALAAGQSCTVNITVHTAGTLGAIPPSGPGTITVADTATTNTFNVSATGVLSSVLTLPVGPLDFGTVTVGEASSTTLTTATIAVSNVASGQTTGAITISLDDTKNFTIATNNCVAAHTTDPVFTLVGGANCTVVVQFTPQSVPTGGVISATLSAASTPGGTATVTVKGTPQSTMYFAMPATLTTPITTVAPATDGTGTTLAVVRRTTSAPKTALLGAAAISGTGAASFSVIDDGCYGSLLDSAEWCSVTVRSSATGTTAKTATLTVGDGTSGNTATIALTYPPA